jgi:hypothetical protein
MAKFRSIWKETFDDEDLAAFPFGCRWLFIGMWLFADDAGVIKSSAKYIKAKVFPYDESLRVSEIEKWLKTLEEARMLIPFKSRNDGYYVIRTFSKYQKIDKRYEKTIFRDDELKTLLDATREKPTGTHGNPTADNIILEEIIEDKKEGAEGTEEDVCKGSGLDSKNLDPPGSGAPPLELAYPWTTEQFLCHWQIWKDYKWQEFKFKYKSIHSEQAALKELSELSKGHESAVIAIINQSIAKSWKGFFELKTSIKNEGTTNKQSGLDYLSSNIASDLERLTGTGG